MLDKSSSEGAVGALKNMRKRRKKWTGIDSVVA